MKPRIMTPTGSYVTLYPQFIELADTQMEDCMWTSNEIDVTKDRQDMKVNMTEAQRHAVTTGLRVFTKYEVSLGNEFWLGKVLKTFPRPEVQRMASVFGMFELAVHAPFYNKLNSVLGLDTDEFYTSYVNDPVLNSRIEFLDRLVDGEDDLVSIAVFSIVEGAILFSNFAVFKSFQSNGINKIGNVVRGINQSVIDEGLHQIGGSMLFRQAMLEYKEFLGKVEYEKLEAYIHSKILEAASKLYEHEARISDMLMEKGDIGTGVTASNLKEFVKSRINICLADLGVKKLFSDEEIGTNMIAGFFYGGIHKYQQNDFFAGKGREYTRGWKELEFVWKGKNG